MVGSCLWCASAGEGVGASGGFACPLSPQRLERRQLSCTRFSGALLRMAPYQYASDGVRVGYLAQEPQLDANKTVRENVMDGVAAQKAIMDRYNDLAMNYSEETADEMTLLQDQIEAQGLWDLDSKVDQAMGALRCPPDDAEVTKLSGGERRRVALCRLLLQQPELLLLDEPTNHLDAETTAWLEGHLRTYPGAILIVTHDRYFLDNVTGWILELDRGRGIPYEGNYSSWLGQKQKRL
ncbi:MAG: hypothetical protein B7Z15_23725, partial [Rhizobiales bacterium 32-66-8]